MSNEGAIAMPDQFVEGIDVSSNQGAVDWATVAAAGISFAIARATLGGHDTDSQFAANRVEAGNAGLFHGAYHFFWPLTPWQDQADNFLKAVGASQSGDLPPAVDLEEAFPKNDPGHDVWNDVPSDQRLAMIQGWLQAVQDGLGMTPMIYTRQNFIENLLGEDVQQLVNYPLWIAHYEVEQPSIPAAWGAWKYWQYTESGNLPGVNGNVDRDKFNGSVEDLGLLAKK
jgi:lysozyme